MSYVPGPGTVKEPYAQVVPLLVSTVTSSRLVESRRLRMTVSPARQLLPGKTVVPKVTRRLGWLTVMVHVVLPTKLHTDGGGDGGGRGGSGGSGGEGDRRTCAAATGKRAASARAKSAVGTHAAVMARLCVGRPAEG